MKGRDEARIEGIAATGSIDHLDVIGGRFEARAALIRIALGPALPSITSAAAEAALFGDFAGTMDGSDFPWTSIIGLRVRPSRCGPLLCNEHRPSKGSPGSQASGFHACERS